MYENIQQQQAGAQGTAGAGPQSYTEAPTGDAGATSGNNDDVVDADFREV